MNVFMKRMYSLGILFILFSATQVSAGHFDITTVQDNGDTAIDFVIVGDGFTSSEQAFFTTKAVEAQNYILTSLPFNAETSKINIHHMEIHSNESGISVEGGVQVDNFFGSYRNREGLYHYTGYDYNQRVVLRNHLKKIFEKKVYVIMIVNDSEYGGSGEFISDKLLSVVQSTYDTQHGLFRELVLHELGHSFGDLADEYGGSCTNADRPDDWDPVFYDKKNVTFDNVNDRKWDFLSNPQYILGANYCDNEWYRSSPAGLMRSTVSGNEHNELGQILITERINEDVAYNSNLISITTASVMKGGNIPTTNVRIHNDKVTLSRSLTCKDLYVAEDSELIVPHNISIHCDSITNLGSITYLRKRTGGKIRYGCKNKQAINYERFSRHKSSLCIFN